MLSEQKIHKIWAVRLELETALKESGFLQNEQWDLIVYGSLLNSICTNELSDLDITLVFENKMMDQVTVLQNLQ